MSCPNFVAMKRFFNYFRLRRYRRLLCKYFKKYVAEDISISLAVELSRTTVAWIVYYESLGSMNHLLDYLFPVDKGDD